MLQTAMVPTRGLTGEQIFTDTQLLALIGRGENWALSEIYARYAGLVFSIGLKTLNDQARDRPALSRSARHHQDSLAPGMQRLNLLLQESV